MGSLSSKSKAMIHLDSSTVTAGSDLSGSIILSIPAALSNVQVQISLAGEEKVTYIIGNDSDWYNNEITYPCTGSIIFQAQNMQPGTFSFPFNIKTLPNLPGSMETYDTYHKASIQYFLNVNVKADDGFSVSKKEKIIVKQTKDQDSKFLSKKKGKTIVKFLKIHEKVEEEIKVKLNKKRLSHGDVAEVSIFSDKLSAEKNKKVSFALHRVVGFKYNKENKAYRSAVVCNFNTNLNAGLLGDQKCLKAEFPIKLKKNQLSGCGSTFGKIIKSKYYLEVNLGKKKVFVPVIIVPQDENQGNPMLTMEDTQIMPVTTIDMH